MILGAIPTSPQPAADIRLFIIGGNIGIHGPGVGTTHRLERTCWVYGDKYTTHDSIEDVMNTVAHEIGHVIVGNGHPDQTQGNPALNNPAPLPHTNRRNRLMASGELSGGPPGRLLVKAEWESSEANLKLLVPNQ